MHKSFSYPFDKNVFSWPLLIKYIKDKIFQLSFFQLTFTHLQMFQFDFC